ncbi:MAG TPA: hypothetical protein VGR16_14850, partial [Thermomicrobiales bacterium]|nr:hypothetical protein [Thermomicrobiales bacterium]
MGDGEQGVAVADYPATGASPVDVPFVVVDDVSVSFNTRKGIFRGEQVRALNGVSAAIARGETLA